ncbi:MAG: T9SS type A sorting domain-containing protein [Sphingobacteriales bacterium]|nr:MAG: T9SS type A sorting domain-containing protein [Sphingobacteriales bacterium]
MKYLICFLAALFLALAAHSSYAQSRLVLNGAYLVLDNGAHLVLGNPEANALTADSGGIICKHPDSRLIWNIGNATGDYVIPFATNSAEPIPVSFTKTAGTGTGFYRLATYQTPTWENSLYLPAGVTHVNDLSGSDNSSQFIDRFWEVNAIGYAVKPELQNMRFTYSDAEHLSQGNTIEEELLQPQQWNSEYELWEVNMAEAFDVSSNTATLGVLGPENQFGYWSLAGPSTGIPLPVHFISFTATANGDVADLAWATAAEENNDYFAVERSADGVNFTELVRVPGAGTTHNTQTYRKSDVNPLPRISYYRIRQVDLDGGQSYTAIRSVVFGGQPGKLTAYPNPATNFQVISMQNWANQAVTVQLTDLQGRTVLNRRFRINNEPHKVMKIDLPELAAGTYLLRVSGSEQSCVQKVQIQK